MTSLPVPPSLGAGLSPVLLAGFFIRNESAAQTAEGVTRGMVIERPYKGLRCGFFVSITAVYFFVCMLSFRAVPLSAVPNVRG